MKRIELNIQLFSGGSYDYMCYSIENTYIDAVYDEELNMLLKDLVLVLHDLEWWQSGDIGEEDYRKTLNDFKKKWFGNRDERLKEIIENKCKELEKYLMNVVGE